jgi:crotonobetainyl-CoA:carnitine CoA-transferase CaiB-like acyl-CoA transferase
MNHDLQAVKVLELASVLAGPSVGLFFAELGAQVIKVENPNTGGDVTRSWRLLGENPQAAVSAYYCAANWGKQVLFADLQNPNDRQAIYAHVADADIVIVNFKQGDDLKLGMDYATLSALNPRLIYAEITAFGNDPSQASRTAYDVVLQAESGFMYMNGEADRPPVKMPVALIDLLAAHQLKEGILLALWQRSVQGKGCRVSVSLFDAAVASLANQATNWLMAGHVPQRIGTQHPNIAPYGDMFSCADGKWLVLAVGSDRQFEQLCKALQQPDLAHDPRFAQNRQRVATRAALNDILQPLFAQYERETILNLLHSHQVPAGAIRTLPEVFEMPAAQALILSETIADMPTQRVKTAVFTLD